MILPRVGGTRRQRPKSTDLDAARRTSYWGSMFTVVVNSIDCSTENKAPNRCLPFDPIGARHPGIVVLSRHTPAANGNLVPAPGVIRDADRAPIPSKGKQRFGALFSVERSIELTTAVASRERNVCDPRPRRLGFYDHATVKSPWHDLSTLRCRWRWIV